MNDSKLVELHGQKYWLLEVNGDGLGGALAYLEHCDEDGDIKDLEAALSESYAHVFEDGIIRRYGKQIGTRSDLVFIEKEAK